MKEDVPLHVLHIECIHVLFAFPQTVKDFSRDHCGKGWLLSYGDGGGGGGARDVGRMGGRRHDWMRCDSRVVVFLVDHGDLRPCRELHIVVRALQPYDKTECLVCMIPFPGCAESIRDGGEYVLCKDGRRGDMMSRGDMSYLLHAAARDLTSCRPSCSISNAAVSTIWLAAVRAIRGVWWMRQWCWMVIVIVAGGNYIDICRR